MTGYDRDPINKNILLDLQFLEGAGVIANDSAKPHHNAPTLIGTPTWTQLANGLNVLDFNSANPDYITILPIDSTNLNFIAEDFSGVIWAKGVWSDNNGIMFIKGNLANVGWEIGRAHV